MVIDTYKVVIASEAILDDIFDEAVKEAGVSGPTTSTLAAYYGTFELLVASVRDIPWDDLASLAGTLMAISDLGLVGLWEVNSTIHLAECEKDSFEDIDILDHLSSVAIMIEVLTSCLSLLGRWDQFKDWSRDISQISAEPRIDVSLS